MHLEVILLDALTKEEYQEKIKQYFNEKFNLAKEDFYEWIHVSDIGLYIKIRDYQISFSSCGSEEMDNYDVRKNVINEIILELFKDNTIAINSTKTKDFELVKDINNLCDFL